MLKKITNYGSLEDNIKKKLFGQDGAVSALVESILVSKSGMRERNKPVGSFLFVGPTGTGKTELCRQLADNSISKITQIRYVRIYGTTFSIETYRCSSGIRRTRRRWCWCWTID